MNVNRNSLLWAAEERDWRESFFLGIGLKRIAIVCPLHYAVARKFCHVRFAHHIPAFVIHIQREIKEGHGEGVFINSEILGIVAKWLPCTYPLFDFLSQIVDGAESPYPFF